MFISLAPIFVPTDITYLPGAYAALDMSNCISKKAPKHDSNGSSHEPDTMPQRMFFTLVPHAGDQAKANSNR